jgi:hypothetical protein
MHERPQHALKAAELGIGAASDALVSASPAHIKSGNGHINGHIKSGNGPRLQHRGRIPINNIYIEDRL